MSIKNPTLFIGETVGGGIPGSAFYTDVNKQLAQDTTIFCVGDTRFYKTIQSALDAIGDATSDADVKTPQTIYIKGGVYDEDLTIPKGRIITLIGEGMVVLGNGLGTSWSSTNTRNINISNFIADIFTSDLHPSLTITSDVNRDSTSTFMAEGGTFRISGDLNISGDGLTTTLELFSVEIDGIISKTSAGLTNFLAYRSIFKGAINNSNGDLILERIQDCQFNSLVTVGGYNCLINSEIQQGMTIDTIYNTMPPSGMFFTTFSGVFTGPPSSLKLDSASDYFFTANGASLAGGATKVFLYPISSSSITGALTSTDWNTFNGKQDAISLIGPTLISTNLFDNVGTPTNVGITYSVVNKLMTIQFHFLSGTPVTSPFAMTLPGSQIIDITKYTNDANTQEVGHVRRWVSNTSVVNTSTGPWSLFYDGSINNKIFIANLFSTTPTVGFLKSDSTSIISAGDLITGTCQVWVA